MQIDGIVGEKGRRREGGREDGMTAVKATQNSSSDSQREEKEEGKREREREREAGFLY